jgi:hypothetical protein
MKPFYEMVKKRGRFFHKVFVTGAPPMKFSSVRAYFSTLSEVEDLLQVRPAQHSQTYIQSNPSTLFLPFSFQNSTTCQRIASAVEPGDLFSCAALLARRHHRRRRSRRAHFKYHRLVVARRCSNLSSLHPETAPVPSSFLRPSRAPPAPKPAARVFARDRDDGGAGYWALMGGPPACRPRLFAARWRRIALACPRECTAEAIDQSLGSRRSSLRARARSTLVSSASSPRFFLFDTIARMLPPGSPSSRCYPSPPFCCTSSAASSRAGPAEPDGVTERAWTSFGTSAT